MAFTRINANFFFIGFLFSFCLFQNAVTQGTKMYTQSNSASWQGKSPFKKFWLLKSGSDKGEDALLLKLFTLLTKENAAFKQLELSDILAATANLELKITDTPEKTSGIVTLHLVLNTVQNQNSNDESDASDPANVISSYTNQPLMDKKNNQPSKFDKMVVDRHNLYRKKHKVANLTYSQQISQISQDWANYLAKNDVFKHRPNNKYGENLYVYWSSNPKEEVSPNSVVDAWYAENKYYTYSKSANISLVGHFTQVVWKNSKNIGVGMARSKRNRQYVVCNYSPPGNVIGQFPQNVLKP